MENKPIITPIVKGDTLVLECTIPEDITGWKIRCEIYDASSSLRLATTNSGGNNDQIEVISIAPEKSVFEIKIPSGATTDFGSVVRTQDGSNVNRADIEIEVDTGVVVAGEPEIITVFQGYVDFKSQRIEWTDPSA